MAESWLSALERRERERERKEEKKNGEHTQLPFSYVASHQLLQSPLVHTHTHTNTERASGLGDFVFASALSA